MIQSQDAILDGVIDKGLLITYRKDESLSGLVMDQGGIGTHIRAKVYNSIGIKTSSIRSLATDLILHVKYFQLFHSCLNQPDHEYQRQPYHQMAI